MSTDLELPKTMSDSWSLSFYALSQDRSRFIIFEGAPTETGIEWTLSGEAGSVEGRCYTMT